MSEITFDSLKWIGQDPRKRGAISAGGVRAGIRAAILLSVFCAMIVHCTATEYAKGTSVALHPAYQSGDPGITFLYTYSNDSMVFLNLPDTDDPRYPPGLWLFSMVKNESRLLSGDPDDGRSVYIPDTGIFGDEVVWRSSFSDNFFHVWNITTGTGFTAPGDAAWGALKTYYRQVGNITVERVERADPAMDGDRLVWTQGFSTATNEPETGLYLMNLTTGEVIPVCEAPGRQERPSISGRYVVWEDTRNGPENPDIYLYDLVTGRESPVCTDPAYQRYPLVSGDFVVWIDFRNGFDFSQIRMFHIPSGTETEIAGGLMRHDLPFISGYRVAYLECIPYSINPRGICQGYLYDIAAGTYESLPKTRNSQVIWGISGDRVLYSEETDTDRQLYLFTLENRTPLKLVIATGEALRESSTGMEAGTPNTEGAGANGEPGFDPVLCIAAVSLAGLCLALGRRWR